MVMSKNILLFDDSLTQLKQLTNKDLTVDVYEVIHCQPAFSSINGTQIIFEFKFLRSKEDKFVEEFKEKLPQHYHEVSGDIMTAGRWIVKAGVKVE